MDRIAQMIKRGAAQISDGELEELAATVQQHPYFQPAQMLYVQALYLRHHSDYGKALRTAAITIPDRSILFNLIESCRNRDGRKRMRTATAENSDRTASLIDNFLDTLPDEQPRRAVKADARTDYMMYLLQTEAENSGNGNATPDLAGQSLIDDFIGQKQGGRIMLSDRSEDELLTPETQENSEFFTETMARIYIKQAKYDKAIKIIERLSAKYPKKNTYFADQMRFLRILIANNKQNKQ